MSDNTEKKEEEHWLKSYWRPAMGWSYFIICLFDFLIAPILNAVFFALFNATKFQQWDPMTLKGAGLYHIAMGAIIGVSAWSRGQEKISVSTTTTQSPYGSSSSMSYGQSSGSSYSPSSSQYTPSYNRPSTTQTVTVDDEPDPPRKGGPFQ
jgi:hypothetical protein